MVSGRINRDLHAAAAVQLLCTVKEIFPGILVGENQGTMRAGSQIPEIFKHVFAGCKSTDVDIFVFHQIYKITFLRHTQEGPAADLRFCDRKRTRKTGLADVLPHLHAFRIRIIVCTLKDQDILIRNIEKQAGSAGVRVQVIRKIGKDRTLLIRSILPALQSVVVVLIQKKRSQIVRNMVKRSIHSCQLQRKRVMIVLYTLLPQKTFAVLASEQNTDKQRDAGDQINPEQPFLCGRFEK